MSLRAFLTSSSNHAARSAGASLASKRFRMLVSRGFGRISDGGDGDRGLERDFLVSLWLADREMESFREKMRRNVEKRRSRREVVLDSQSTFHKPLERFFSGSAIKEFAAPASPQEARVAPLLARSNLVVTRDIEWANLAFGFEQENRYAIVDPCYPQSPVGFIREQSNVLARQFLRSRRPFVAYIFNNTGDELFRIHRPFWWITSSIYTEIDGKEVGVVHRRWHLWRRIYDLYLGNKQFAVVENPGLWNWTFTLKDIDGKVLAEIDRNWRGFGFEILTDAGQYAIRFGSADTLSESGSAGIQELEVSRPLTLSERAVALALAVSLDNDYFSRHGGWGLPFIAVEE